MSFNNLIQGRLGEKLASSYLRKKGYRIISQNFRAKYGEIDIISLFKKTLVFVEVKTRSGNIFGSPQEAVTRWKLANITKTAQYFKLLHPELPEAMQIDVVSVQFDTSGNLKKIEHLDNVTG